ncbi:DUF1311 domain-containing protein [Paracoccus sp. TK19116]|uniref:DUF1311 domain-containing protein n=1 Tax=Paracoccus albicereus TaxID=2922394 RepID=A0ABT1MSG5_9RHOB|nr:lysozyme inhibitor LprI family protein [Paracoccus albicereus]MCQ0970293.1 DUF1311 domain-containing protein [Paracoccus albicereus]
MKALVLLMSLAAAGVASAQASEPLVDAAAVEACFADALPGDGSPDCLGDQVKACTEASPDGETTIGMGACIQAETAVWDDLLNREYTARRDDWSDRPELVETLTKAQRAWIAFRDADCSLAYDRWDGGSMRSIAAANCRMVATARRALDLKDMGPM